MRLSSFSDEDNCTIGDFSGTDHRLASIHRTGTDELVSQIRVGGNPDGISPKVLARTLTFFSLQGKQPDLALLWALRFCTSRILESFLFDEKTWNVPAIGDGGNFPSQRFIRTI